MTVIQQITPELKLQIGNNVTINGSQYTKLLDYLVGRIDFSKDARCKYLPVFKYIDREYMGYLKRDDDDQKRAIDNINATGLKPTDEKLSLIFSQMDEAITFLLTVLAPDDAMYSAIAPSDKQPAAKGFAALMNIHDEIFGHYENIAMFLLDCVKYNLGAFGVDWEEVTGNTVENSKTQTGIEIVNKVIATGNKLTSFDPYNLLLDPTVAPVKISTEGEYFGVIELHNEFRLKLMKKAGILTNIDRFITTEPVQKYYEEHEQVRDDYIDVKHSTDWVHILTGGARESLKSTSKAFEIIKVCIRLIPKEFGLSKSEDYEIWRFSLGSDVDILHAEHLENAHNMLPINIAMPVIDHFKLQTKGFAERLIPYQRFGSFIWNTHQRAVRKRLYGLTIYDQNVIPQLAQSHVDMTGGKIPANMSGMQTDIKKHITQFTDGPDTTNSLENISLMRDLMQNILPTDLLKQVTNLQRATQYQAASVVQAGSKRNLKIAKLVNSQAMTGSRQMQMLNIFQFQETIEIITQQGELITADPKEFRDGNIQFTISDGLRGLDRFALQLHMKEMFNTIVQSQQASSQADVMALANHLSSLFGDFTDFSQFKLKSPIDSLPLEQRDMAWRLLREFLAGETGQQQP